jgi:hypothetical protein
VLEQQIRQPPLAARHAVVVLEDALRQEALSVHAPFHTRVFRRHS